MKPKIFYHKSQRNLTIRQGEKEEREEKEKPTYHQASQDPKEPLIQERRRNISTSFFVRREKMISLGRGKGNSIGGGRWSGKRAQRKA